MRRELSSATTFFVPWLYPDGVAVARASRGSGTRLWLMALGSDTFHLRSWFRRRRIVEACAQAEGVICVAQVLADRLAAAGVPREKLYVVPNGVDPSLFRMRSKEELSSCSVDKLLSERLTVSLSSTTQQPSTLTTIPRIILFIGNLVPVKGADVLLKAVAILKKTIDLGPQATDQEAGSVRLRSKIDRRWSMVDGRWSKVSLTLIGDGPMRPQLERLARTLGISDRIHFLGRLPPEEVALWMHRADVLCLPSRSEGMPNVVLEARASGLPVVATPAGSIPELPLDRKHFLVVESCTPEALADGLREMLGRDLSTRQPDPAISTWSQMAGKVLKLMGIMG